MFKSAVVCTDGGPESDVLISIVPRLRQFGVSRVTLVCPHSEDGAAAETALVGRIMAQEAALALRGFEAHAVVRHGAASATVGELCAEIGADMVVVGVGGLGRSARLLVGGTGGSATALGLPMLSLRVSSAGIVPVQVVSRVPMLAKVLIATDFSDASERAMLTVEALVRDGLGEVVLLRVTGQRGVSAEERLRLRINADRIRAAGRVRVAEEIVDSESVAESIIHRAHVGDVTLTVLGSRAHGLFDGLVAGSVGAEVARHIESPLLVVPGAQVVEPGEALSA